MSELCSNCQQEPRVYKGLCRKCYNYRVKHRQARPSRLWDRKAEEGGKAPAPLGSKCLCGQPASVLFTLSTKPGARLVYYEEPLCDECAAIEEDIDYVYA